MSKIEQPTTVSEAAVTAKLQQVFKSEFQPKFSLKPFIQTGALQAGVKRKLPVGYGEKFNPLTFQNIHHDPLMDDLVDTTVGVYNKFDIGSVIAAAYWKTMTRAKTVLPSDTMSKDLVDRSVVFIGLSPLKKDLFEDVKIVMEKSVVIDDKVGDEITHRYQVTKSILDVIRGQYEMMESPLANRLSFLIARFYDKKLEIEDLVFVYRHYNKALRCLQGLEEFDFAHPTSDDTEAFATYLRKVKFELSNGYKKHFIQNKKTGEYSYIPVTSCNNDTYVWMKRLMLLAYPVYLNDVSTPEVHIVDTNMSNPKGLFIDFEFKYSNQF